MSTNVEVHRLTLTSSMKLILGSSVKFTKTIVYFERFTFLHRILFLNDFSTSQTNIFPGPEFINIYKHNQIINDSTN